MSVGVRVWCSDSRNSGKLWMSMPEFTNPMNTSLGVTFERPVCSQYSRDERQILSITIELNFIKFQPNCTFMRRITKQFQCTRLDWIEANCLAYCGRCLSYQSPIDATHRVGTGVWRRSWRWGRARLLGLLMLCGGCAPIHWWIVAGSNHRYECKWILK